MKSKIIFETPTRKGWLTIHEIEKSGPLDVEYLVVLAAEKDLEYINSHLVPNKTTHSTENNARWFAQGLYIGVECI